MKKVLAFLSLLVFSLTMVACKPDKPIENETVVLKTRVAGEQAYRLFTYYQSNPLIMPDGTIINNGDLKPVWQYVENQLNIDIQDQAVANQKTKDMFDLAAANQFKDSNIYGGNNIAQRIMEAGVDGYFVDLNDYLDKMPEFKKYLEENPLVKSSITASDGGIYHIPYIAEINNYARMYAGRYSWVTLLLDGKVNDKEFSLENETATLNVSYEPYWTTGTNTKLLYGGKRNNKNVIELQDTVAEDGVLTGLTALTVLKNYIKETYPNLENLSDLYLGSEAQYDIDELIALWRVVKLFPKTLSKEATGTANSEATIYPYFTRKSDYQEEFLRLMNYFGGVRVHGSDAYGARFYLDKDGNLKYSYYEEDFISNLNRLKEIAEEGLVDERIFGAKNSTDLRKLLYFSDNAEGTKVFGFMMYDWTASTTANTNGQDDVIGMLPPVTTTPVSNNEFIHYVENTRVIKPDGWGISINTTGKELDASLKLLNYLFTDEGYQVQNYGTPDLWEETEKYHNPFDNTESPKFNSWTVQKAKELTNSDISTFLRDHIGAQIPIGYQKEIGFELQSTSENGMKSWQIYFDADNGKGVTMSSYSASNPYYQLVPPVFALTSEESSIINNTTSMNNEAQLVSNMFAYLGGKVAEGVPTSAEEVKQSFKDAKIETFIQIYRTAYARMIA